MTALVSIACVTYHRREHVLNCLASCVSQNYPRIEIVVVVNPAGDGTEEAIAREYPQARMIRTHRNRGFFPALNLAVANCSGDYVMTVDDDAYFLETDAIARLVAAFAEEPELGAATCNLEGPSETPVKDDCYVHLFTTGFTMLPRKVFTEWVGYYPDMFFRSGGETYVCAALWDKGRRVKRLAGVRMYHARTMDGRSVRDWTFHGLRSQILVTIMRAPWAVVAPSLASKWCKSVVQYARWGHLATWAHSWLSVLACLPEALRMRDPIRWRTQKLLWRLREQPASDVATLERLGGRLT